MTELKKDAETNHTDDAIICDCTGTTRAKIKDLYVQGFDLDAIASKTGVSTGCGGCEWEIESLIEELQKKNET